MSNANATSADPTAKDKYPEAAYSKICKFVFVMVPQVPAFSPVVINSNFKSLDVLDAIYFSYGFSGSIGTQTCDAPGGIGFHVITDTDPVATFI